MDKNDFLAAVGGALKILNDAGIKAHLKVTVLETDVVSFSLSADDVRVWSFLTPDPEAPVVEQDKVSSPQGPQAAAMAAVAPGSVPSAPSEAPGEAQAGTDGAVPLQEAPDAPVGQDGPNGAESAPSPAEQAPESAPESPDPGLQAAVPADWADVPALQAALASAQAIIRGDTDAGASELVLALDRQNVADAQAKLAPFLAEAPASTLPFDHDGASIAPGATVVLNGGGPDMTVVRIAQDGTLTCAWTADGGPEQFSTFSPATVTIKKQV